MQGNREDLQSRGRGPITRAATERGAEEAAHAALLQEAGGNEEAGQRYRRGVSQLGVGRSQELAQELAGAE